MSGGHFQYKQYELGHIADEIEQLILDNDSNEKNEYGDVKGYHFTPETIAEFEVARLAILRAQVLVHRIDWLISGDDGEDSFHRRLSEDFDALYRRLGGVEDLDVL